ncbi:MAG: acyl-ACP--UDP-N-acetylglucosamine O-acyltransferase [Helicobacter sp.]|nr:acyl-ACP--UDP-N-acetylglucosamine O-acyltransferase [Helicobacter sp.]
MKIAKTAIIEPGAQIDDGVEIGHFCVIGSGVSIASGTKVMNNVTILGDTIIGKNNVIFPNATLGTQPQDLKYEGEKVELVIGDNNIIREHCMFNPGTKGGISQTIIGNSNLFMTFSHVAHDCVIGDNCIFANNATLGGHVEVGNYVNFGGLSAAHQFVKIGSGAMIAAGSILFQDAPPYVMCDGQRAAIRGLNRHRMRLLFDRECIDLIASLYRRIFSKDDLMTNNAKRELEALKAQESSNIHSVLKEICEFVIASKRGIPINKGQI